ncbi:MAG: ArdC family protein [Acidobacteriales bacterium]|nr:ArdC family protein [Terriglobales bacterium]
MSLIDDKIRLSWRELLEAAVTQPGLIHEAYSRFWNYSLGNQILALLQCHARSIQPGPIATFQRWKELGRHVRKGEKALTLCMPITLYAKEWERRRAEAAGDAAANNADDAGARTIFVYRSRWFVLSQTEGNAYESEPLPDWDREAALATLGIQEEPFTMLDGNCQGYATTERKIAISQLAALPWKTLFHEMAHIVLGHIGSGPMIDGEKISRSLKEVEAEAVALICCETLRLPGAAEARGYIQHWLEGETIPENAAQRIFQATDHILRARTSSIADVKEDRFQQSRACGKDW